MTRLAMNRDINGFVTYGLPFADASEKYSMLLSAGVADSVTVPNYSAKYLAIFAYSPGAEVWVANNYTAAVPIGAAASTTSELNPVAREVKAGDSLSFITPDSTARVAVIFLSRD